MYLAVKFSLIFQSFKIYCYLKKSPYTILLLNFNKDWSRFLFVLFWFSYSMIAFNFYFSPCPKCSSVAFNNTVCTFPFFLKNTVSKETVPFSYCSWISKSDFNCFWSVLREDTSSFKFFYQHFLFSPIFLMIINFCFHQTGRLSQIWEMSFVSIMFLVVWLSQNV